MRAAMFVLMRSAAAGGPDGPDASTRVFDSFAARLDADHDGVLSRAEFDQMGEPAAFADIDHDADGVVSGAELRAWIVMTSPRPPARDPSAVLSPGALSPLAAAGASGPGTVAGGGAAAAQAGPGTGNAGGCTARRAWAGAGLAALGLAGTFVVARRRSRRVRRWLG